MRILVQLMDIFVQLIDDLARVALIELGFLLQNDKLVQNFAHHNGVMAIFEKFE